MKHLFLMVLIVAGAFAASPQAQARDQRWRQSGERGSVRQDVERSDPGHREDRFAERRERLRALREEVQRAQPPRPQPDRDEDARRMPPERREYARPPPGEGEGLRRLSPEERREFRRQIHEAGRNAYRNQ
ncbi:MAG: hypothetical protein JWL63_3393 [Rhodocyclales bacterium]|nr:hypothetical protein [Rhodocyclales bacterium]